MQGVGEVRRLVRLSRVLPVLALIFLVPACCSVAQAVRIGRPRPKPQLFSFASLTVTASPTAVSFNLVHGGPASGSAAVAVTTTYTFGVSFSGQLTLYGYFSSASNAMTGGSPSASIPSSDILGLVPTGTPTSYTAFTQTTPYSGASGLQLYQITSIYSFSGSRTDNLSLQIDLTSTPQLPAATYTGTLSLEAQAF